VLRVLRSAKGIVTESRTLPSVALSKDPDSGSAYTYRDGNGEFSIGDVRKMDPGPFGLIDFGV
jgi:hypothetical protein